MENTAVASRTTDEMVTQLTQQLCQFSSNTTRTPNALSIWLVLQEIRRVVRASG